MATLECAPQDDVDAEAKQAFIHSTLVSGLGETRPTEPCMEYITRSVMQQESMKININDNFTQINPRGREMFLRLAGKTPINLEFTNLTYSVRVGDTKKVILDNLSGEFKPGKMIAVMGQSGAGKSTLTNILAGYITKEVEGIINVNGKKRSLHKFRKNSCYIMQEDILLPHLSVQEAMLCSANLKLVDSMERKEELVNIVLDVLGLLDARHTRTLCLSGGQKKRLAIALELISNPSIMFFDEPTSGLDSSSCFQCISLLKQLAKGGRTIICTIHQPSSRIFRMFDYLYFVSRGQCIYRGSPKALVSYLGSQGLQCPGYHNPADYFMEVASGDYDQQLVGDTTDWVERLAASVRSGECDRFMVAFSQTRAKLREVNGISISGSSTSSTSLPEELRVEDSPSSSDCEDDQEVANFSTSLFNQFRVLYVRTFLSIIRDTQLTRLRLFSHLSVGLLIGLLYFRIGNDGEKAQSNAGCLFFCMLFLMFTALMPTVLTFPMEMSIFLREHLNSWYSVKAYYLAKTLADLPFQIIFPVLYGSIVYWLTGQPAEFMRFFMFLTVCVQTSMVAQSFGLLIGAAVNLESAVFLGPVTAIPILLFSGFFVTFDTIPVYLQWLSYISYVRYAFEGVLQSIYGYNREKLTCSEVITDNLTPCFDNPNLFLQFFSADKAKYYIDFIVLCIFFVILRGICFIILKVRSRARR